MALSSSHLLLYFIGSLYLQIMSKGNVVAQGQRNATWKSNSFEILFDEDLAQRASPSSRVLVWCLTSTGEIIVDSVELVVDGTFANSVSINFKLGVNGLFYSKWSQFDEMKGTYSSLYQQNNIKSDFFFSRLLRFHRYLTLNFRTIHVVKRFFTIILCVTNIYALVGKMIG